MTAGRTDAITITVTKNQVTWTASGRWRTIDFLIEGTTAGAVDHLKGTRITEFHTGTPQISEYVEDEDGWTFEVFRGFHGTGNNGSRDTWRERIVGQYIASTSSPDFTDPNFRRIVACYVAYGDAKETQWNMACVIVLGEGAGTIGSGDQSVGTPNNALIVALLFLIGFVVCLVVATIVSRPWKTRAWTPPPHSQHPPQPPPG